MDIKSEVEIKDELIESNEDFINDQENVFYPSVDIKEEIELKVDPLYIKEEDTESESVVVFTDDSKTSDLVVALTLLLDCTMSYTLASYSSIFTAELVSPKISALNSDESHIILSYSKSALLPLQNRPSRYSLGFALQKYLACFHI
ncbi:hypothetical protein Avbf_13636 [Armadillidium vulgare]|nr:hypothetical protein Avbf_13636 [Armadillidium vulgare]